MSATHTPGPWALIGKQGTAIWADNAIIAQVSGARAFHAIARKNAELMASAPELLEALETLFRHGHQDHCFLLNKAGGECDCGIVAAEAIIAKAKGGAAMSATSIPHWSDLGNEPMTKREQIAALMMHAHISRGRTQADAAEFAVDSANALIFELKRRKDPQQ